MRVPPHNGDAERLALLCALLGADVSEAEGIATSEDFYRTDTRETWDAIVALTRRSKTIDQSSVRAELAQRGKLEAVGGDEFLLGLAEMVSAAPLAEHLATVRDYSVRRRAIGTLHELTASGYDTAIGTSEFLERAESEVMRAVDRGALAVEVSDARSSLERFWLRSIKIREAGGLIGVRSGIASLDKMIGGFWTEELTTLGGRPSMGKTALLETCAVNALAAGARPLFFSLEMSESLLWPRILAKVAGLDSAAIKEQSLTREGFDDLSEAMRFFRESPFRVVAKAGLSIGQIRAIARRERKHHGVDVVFVDYLQKIGGTRKHERRDLEIAEVSSGLAELARELRIPVVVGAQINRGVANRSDKRPMPSDLRESGSIENDSDAIVLIHREAYYRHEQVASGERPQNDGETIDLGAAELIVGKNRNGPTGIAHCRFLGERCQFVDAETRPREYPEHWSEA